MLLYDYFRSSAAYRMRIALNLKGLAYDHRSIHLRKGEQRAGDYLAVNPQGLVPTLVIGGGIRLTQSLAIIEYLEERHPLPPLLPESAEDRAWVRAIALTVACDIHPINNTRVIQYLQNELQVDDAKRDAWYAHWIRLGFEAIEAQLAARGGGPFAYGGKPGLADICIVPQVANAGRVKLPMDPYPRIRALNAACLALPAFDKARPENHPDRE
jgi:maleylacetoacetate isomerase